MCNAAVLAHSAWPVGTDLMRRLSLNVHAKEAMKIIIYNGADSLRRVCLAATFARPMRRQSAPVCGFNVGCDDDVLRFRGRAGSGWMALVQSWRGSWLFM